MENYKGVGTHKRRKGRISKRSHMAAANIQRRSGNPRNQGPVHGCDNEEILVFSRGAVSMDR